MSRHEIISPAEIERRVAEGQPVVIYEGYVLHLGEWIEMHPGGRLAILHMVGRDATDEINMLVIQTRLDLHHDVVGGPLGHGNRRRKSAEAVE
jgi:cytochrome b involved in lipid metabolism